MGSPCFAGAGFCIRHRFCKHPERRFRLGQRQVEPAGAPTRKRQGVGYGGAEGVDCITHPHNRMRTCRQHYRHKRNRLHLLYPAFGALDCLQQVAQAHSATQEHDGRLPVRHAPHPLPFLPHRLEHIRHPRLGAFP